MILEKAPSPSLEYNLASGLLLTINEKDFQELQTGLKNAGYSSACVLPFRTLMKESGMETLHNSPLSIVHIEEAWNPTDKDNLTKAVVAGLVGYYRRFRGLPGNNPILQDSLFPSKHTCDGLFKSLIAEFPNIKFISHQLDVDFPEDRLLVEINAGINLSPSELLTRAKQKGIGLVFDPSHLLPSDRTISMPGDPTRKVNEWEKQWLYFSPQVKVVDINPPDKKNDVPELLADHGVLKEIAQAAHETGVEFLRVEIPIPPSQQIPGLRPHTAGFSFLKEIGNALIER
jgi:hypothetical protein